MVEKLYAKHYVANTAGWSLDYGHRPSVFATSHTLAALEVLQNALTVDAYLASVPKESIKPMENKVFIVHGHEKGVKQEVARVVEKLGCEAKILDEQIDSGITTIFEKFTAHARQSSYAIVLLTPDDLPGDVSGDSRARQNVILELGFFLGHLGPGRVCLAKKGKVDIPSDIGGVLYLNLDDGGWKLDLAGKLKAAGLKVDIEKMIGG
jgi:predicted nucleotide-binding protein